MLTLFLAPSLRERVLTTTVTQCHSKMDTGKDTEKSGDQNNSPGVRDEVLKQIQR